MIETAKLSLTIICCLGLLMLIGACEGPTGPDGAQGPAGTEGPVGPAGEDGSTIHAGDGTPDNELGEIGDYYLDLQSGDLFGPKSEDGWGDSISLIGPEGQQGEPGEDGTRIYSGSQPPDNSIGDPGDFYLKTDTYDLYGPKTDTGWGAPLNLQGPEGPAGQDGNANVITKIIELTNDDYVNGYYSVKTGPSSSLGYQARLAHIDDDDITQEIAEDGLVMAYMKVPVGLSSSNLQWHPLPFNLLSFDGVYYTNYAYTYLEGRITFYFYFQRNFEDGTMPGISGYSVPPQEYKYVIISADGVSAMESLRIDTNDAEEVDRYLRESGILNINEAIWYN
jgi:hypothetical protein